MTKEELLKKAKQDYPIGTVFKCVKDGEEGESTDVVVMENDKSSEGGGIYTHYSSRAHMNQYVYYRGKWAKIVRAVSKPEIINQYQIY